MCQSQGREGDRSTVASKGFKGKDKELAIEDDKEPGAKDNKDKEDEDKKVLEVRDVALVSTRCLGEAQD